MNSLIQKAELALTAVSEERWTDALDHLKVCEAYPFTLSLWTELWDCKLAALMGDNRLDQAYSMLEGQYGLEQHHLEKLLSCCRALGLPQKEQEVLSELLGDELSPRLETLLEREISPEQQFDMLKQDFPLRALELIKDKLFDLKAADEKQAALDLLEQLLPGLEDLVNERGVLMVLCEAATLRLECGKKAQGVELFQTLLSARNRRAALAEIERAIPLAPELEELLQKGLAMPPVAPMHGQLFNPSTGALLGHNPDSEDLLIGPGGVQFLVERNKTAGMDGCETTLRLKDQYRPHPANGHWSEAWLATQGLSNGVYPWGSFAHYWMDEAIFHFDTRRPSPKTVLELIDLERGTVRNHQGEHIDLDNSKFKIQTNCGAFFQVSMWEGQEGTVISLDLIEPAFEIDLDIPGKPLRLPCRPKFLADAALRADGKRKAWLENWLEKELGVKDGQKFSWGRVELTASGGVSTGIALNQVSEPTSGLRKFLNFFRVR